MIHLLRSTAGRSCNAEASMRWITREHPKIDRVACPWLITRFIDPQAEFLFAPPADVRTRADELKAIPYDVEGVELSHDGPLCSFDALYAWLQHAKGERHTWNPQRAPAPV